MSYLCLRVYVSITCLSKTATRALPHLLLLPAHGVLLRHVLVRALLLPHAVDELVLVLEGQLGDLAHVRRHGLVTATSMVTVTDMRGERAHTTRPRQEHNTAPKRR